MRWGPRFHHKTRVLAGDRRINADVSHLPSITRNLIFKIARPLLVDGLVHGHIFILHSLIRCVDIELWITLSELSDRLENFHG